MKKILSFLFVVSFATSFFCNFTSVHASDTTTMHINPTFVEDSNGNTNLKFQPTELYYETSIYGTRSFSIQIKNSASNKNSYDKTQNFDIKLVKETDANIGTQYMRSGMDEGDINPGILEFKDVKENSDYDYIITDKDYKKIYTGTLTTSGPDFPKQKVSTSYDTLNIYLDELIYKCSIADFTDSGTTGKATTQVNVIIYPAISDKNIPIDIGVAGPDNYSKSILGTKLPLDSTGTKAAGIFSFEDLASNSVYTVRVKVNGSTEAVCSSDIKSPTWASSTGGSAGGSNTNSSAGGSNSNTGTGNSNSGTSTSSGETKNIDSLLASINKVFINPLIILIFTLALCFFIYGVVAFLINSDNEEARTEGKSHMIWGIIGMFIMISVFAIENILIKTFDINYINPQQGTVNLPQAPK